MRNVSSIKIRLGLVWATAGVLSRRIARVAVDRVAVDRVCVLTTAAAISVAAFCASASPAAAQNGDFGGTGSWVTKQGRHIRLVTDLADSDQLNRWVATFDDAVPQWARYWNRDADAVKDFRVTAYLMVDKSAFVAKGVLPRSLPDFRHGYQSGDSLWVNHQPSDYYNAHLLLHEGAHAIAAHFFGGGGPPWYSEGTAEWLSVHETAPTRIGIIPESPESVIGWGRLELIAAGRDANRIPSIESVMRYGDTAHRDVEPYAWSWLAVALMETYPKGGRRRSRHVAGFHANLLSIAATAVAGIVGPLAVAGRRHRLRMATRTSSRRPADRPATTDRRTPAEDRFGRHPGVADRPVQANAGTNRQPHRAGPIRHSAIRNGRSG